MRFVKPWLILAVFLVPMLAIASYRLESHHMVLNALLRRYVKSDTVFTANSSYTKNTVQYGLLGADPRWPEYCKRLLRVDSTTVKSASLEDRKAFWLNTYNATVLHAVLLNYPLENARMIDATYPRNSIQQIPDAWTTKYPVSPGALSLKQIDSKIRTLEDPRIYFAMHRAAMDSPVLSPQAYTTALLDEQLDRACANFIVNPGNVRLDRAKNELQLSAVFEWYLEDFNVAMLETPPAVRGYQLAERGVIAFVMKWMSKEEQRYISEKTPKVTYKSFDWTLNEAK